jgi:hypothetical protein
MSRESELNLMRSAQGDKAGVIKSRPSTDQFRDNYDQINWHRGKVTFDNENWPYPIRYTEYPCPSKTKNTTIP